MSLRITFLNQKGGVGKSTTAALVAGILQEVGYRVAADDRDPQRTLEFWAREVGRVPLLGAVDNPDVIVTDTPGRLDFHQDGVLSQFREIVQQSDRILLVSEKTLFSLHAAAPMLRVIRDIGGPSVRVLFNKVRRCTSIGRQNEADLAAKLGVAALKSHLPLASAFERMETEGLRALSASQRALAQNLALEILE